MDDVRRGSTRDPVERPGLYARHVLPRLVSFACSRPPTMRQREKIVPRARGRVLEVGIGPGLNLPFYDPARVRRLWGLDPSVEMTARADGRRRDVDFEVELIEGRAEEIPLEDASVDTILATYTLCTIADVVTALSSMRRVLHPRGELLFCEHGAAPDTSVRRWQNRLNPLWRRLGGGCNLNRPIPALLERGGFRIREMDARYLPGWRPGSFNYLGAAVHA
jgi:SAM-dependent methyltransferase